MKRLLIQSVPLTVIAMALFTKWWMVIPVDGSNTSMSGFPFPFIADGWHTSLSYQIFITEFLADFFTQLLLWTLILFLTHKYLFDVKIPKVLNSIIWGLAIIISGLAIFIGSMPNQIIQLKRDWEIQTVLNSGYQFIWEDQPRQ
ncbi:hypothetical protein [Chryseobacterium herbae]|uniref:Uncharacterized protein n=1 Tax=Chryseobacterium herbae TaxID=2976476 RepID=A0ABT2IR35_9FLAO|nr:hypothetical protein [Chryseobacterium sp. pc1-10]MCT2561125.1 hypothetical protein [Chryseobacterium sp. pc1-10]